MKPDALPLLVVIWTAPAWMLSIRSASDDLLSSERSAAPMNWMLSEGLSGGAGVLVLGGAGVFVVDGIGVLVLGRAGVFAAGGVGVLVLGGAGVFVAGGAGVLVLEDGRDSVGLTGSSAHPAIMLITMNDQRTSRPTWPFIWNPLMAMD